MNNLILVVSDDHDFFATCEQGAELVGFSLEHCTNYLAARDSLNSDTRYCAVICDLQCESSVAGESLSEASANNDCIFMLSCKENEISEALELTNKMGYFRLLPHSASANDLAKAFNDGQREYQLLLDTTEQQAVEERPTNVLLQEEFYNTLERELQRCIRYGHNLSLILCDIDHSEATAALSTEALQKLVQVAVEMLRPEADWIAPRSDDSLYIVLPETPIRGAGTVAERLKEKVIEMEMEHKGEQVSLTASFGVACYSPAFQFRNRNAEELIDIVDHCLRQAKASGGNQVLCCP
jgi:diguanylate cyclase (GGDEF)-like protein